MHNGLSRPSLLRGGELNGQSLNLTAEEKQSVKDIQAYEYWCFERQEEDNFKSLNVQITPNCA